MLMRLKRRRATEMVNPIYTRAAARTSSFAGFASPPHLRRHLAGADLFTLFYTASRDEP